MEGYMKALFIGIMILMVSTTACRNEILEISGTITDVNYLAEGSSFNAPDIIKTIVTFKDGRRIAFNGISNNVFYIGQDNTIYYSRKMKIREVILTRNDTWTSE